MAYLHILTFLSPLLTRMGINGIIWTTQGRENMIAKIKVWSQIWGLSYTNTQKWCKMTHLWLSLQPLGLEGLMIPFYKVDNEDYKMSYPTKSQIRGKAGGGSFFFYVVAMIITFQKWSDSPLSSQPVLRNNASKLATTVRLLPREGLYIRKNKINRYFQNTFLNNFSLYWSFFRCFE